MIRRAAVLLLSSTVACTADAAIAGVPSPAVPAAIESPPPPNVPAEPEPAAAGSRDTGSGASLAVVAAGRAGDPDPLAAATDAEALALEVGCVPSLEEMLPDGGMLAADGRRRREGSVMVVRKAARRLMLFEDGVRTLCMRVGLGFAPAGHKQAEGDGRTPEGWYRTSDKPWSSFDHAIAVHYPNDEDARAAAADGRIGAKTRDRIVADVRAGRTPPQSTKLGGAVLIHGGGSVVDWTLGCIALEDAELLTLRERLPQGMRTDLLVLP